MKNSYGLGANDRPGPGLPRLEFQCRSTIRAVPTSPSGSATERIEAIAQAVLRRRQRQIEVDWLGKSLY